jgi:hypothetical protein
MVKKIGKIAEALSTNRSGAIRFLVEAGLESGQAILVLRQGLGRGKIDRIVQAHAAQIKAQAAQAAADRTPDNAEAQANASRAKREAIDRERAVADPQYARFSRLPSAKSPLTSSRRLSRAEAKEAADWAKEQLAALTQKKGGA